MSVPNLPTCRNSDPTIFFLRLETNELASSGLNQGLGAWVCYWRWDVENRWLCRPWRQQCRPQILPL